MITYCEQNPALYKSSVFDIVNEIQLTISLFLLPEGSDLFEEELLLKKGKPPYYAGISSKRIVDFFYLSTVDISKRRV